MDRRREHSGPEAGSEDFSRALVRAAPIPMFTLAVEDGSLTSTNPAFDAWTGYDPESPGGLSMTSYVHPGDVAAFISNLHQAMLGQHPSPFELRMKASESSYQISELSLLPESKDGKLVQILGFVRDLRERRSIIRDLRAARDAAEAGSRAKTEFLANMSHEIRTPLNAIVAVSGLLRDMQLDGQSQSFAEIIRTSSKTLLELINSVLDFSKIESEKLELENQPFSIEDCVASSVELVSSQASEKGLVVDAEIDDSCPPAIFGDVTRVRQILVNLLSNAVKFTESGAVDVYVSSRAAPARKPRSRASSDDALDEGQVEEGQVEVLFEVRDSGIGIPIDKQAKIFDVFSQADASTTRRFGGTGLGLTISRRLTELMGGTISVESEPGRGSVFSFSIRGRPARLSQTPDQALQTDTELASKLPLRILVAEDHPTNQIVARLLLQRMGYEPDVVDNGRQAVDAVAEAQQAGRPYDVVLMDVHMPILDGLAATREIRDTWQEARPKIAAVTASTLKGDRERCLAAGVDEFLGKPIFADELEAMLKLMGGYRADETDPSPSAEVSSDGAESDSGDGKLPRLDTAFLDNLVMLGDDQAAELAGSYLSSARETLQTLEDAATRGDGAAVASGSHRIKGASGIFGARRLESICRRLEEGSTGREPDELQDDVAELRDELGAVEAELLKRLGSGSADPAR